MAAASSWKIKFPHFEKQGLSATLRLSSRRRMSPCAAPGELLTKSGVARMGLSSQDPGPRVDTWDCLRWLTLTQEQQRRGGKR